MKTMQDGRLKLAGNERRVAEGSNFIIKDEKTHIKVTDINATASFRVRKGTAAGRYLEMCYRNLGDEGARRALQNQVAVAWSFLCCVPDAELLATVHKAVGECITRNAAIYGAKAAQASEGDDREALRSVREMKEIEKAVRDIPDEG